MKLKYFLLILLIILIIGLLLIDTSESVKSRAQETFTRQLYENGSMEVYFCPEEDCNQVMLKELQKADEISCAFYDLNDRELLIELQNNNAGLIIHHENVESEHEPLAVPRETDGLMHNKFCILDNSRIITGSHNPTQGGNRDNVLVMDSDYLAQNYNSEYQNLLHYPADEKRRTKNSKIIFNGYELENYFCPQDNCQREILEELSNAEDSIYFLTYTFTDSEIASALVSKKNAGLEVRGAIESYQGKTYWVYPQLLEGNVSVILDGENVLQHNKVFIIDNKTVITGSFNPTKSANTRNDENIVILREPRIVSEYLENFEYLYGVYSNQS